MSFLHRIRYTIILVQYNIFSDRLVEYFKLFYKVKKFSAVVHIPNYVRTNPWCFVKVFKNLDKTQKAPTP